MLELVIICSLIGLLPAAIASRKGYSFLGWWSFGALLFIVALPVSLFIKPDQATRRDCPWCRTSIDRQALVCPQCSRDVPAAEPVPAAYARRPWEV